MTYTAALLHQQPELDTCRRGPMEKSAAVEASVPRVWSRRCVCVYTHRAGARSTGVRVGKYIAHWAGHARGAEIPHTKIVQGGDTRP